MITPDIFNRIQSLKPSEISVLVIDMQTGFLEKRKETDKKTIQYLPEREELEIKNQIKSILTILEWAKDYKIKPVFINWANYGDSLPELTAPFEVISDFSFESPLFEIASAYSYIKKENDAFRKPENLQPSLDYMLKQIGVKAVIGCGINASACVLETLDHAVDKGYDVSLSPDLISDPLYNNEAEKSLVRYAKRTVLLPENKDIINLFSHSLNQEEAMRNANSGFWKRYYDSSLPVEFICQNEQCGKLNYYFLKNRIPYLGKIDLEEFNKSVSMEKVSCIFCGTFFPILIQKVNKQFFQQYLRTWQRQDSIF